MEGVESMNLYESLDTCLACGSDTLSTVLDLGTLAISDFPRHGETLDYAPLRLRRCGMCEMVQLSHRVDRDRLYSDYYYTSGLNESMVRALADVVTEAKARVHLEPGDAVLDIGANDGTLLRQYPSWLTRIGFEPSSAASLDPGLTIHKRFFPDPKVPPVACKIITACAMFYDLEDPGAFLEGVKRWLHPDGVFVVQMPDLYQMLRENAFDNACHEHLGYYPTRTLYHLAQVHGLRLVQMDTNKVNGGSVRYTFAHGPRVPDAFREHPTEFYLRDLRDFARRVEDLRAATRQLLLGLRAVGKRVWAYGASTKGNTLLQYYGIGPDLIEAVADRNPEKWGRETVTGIPITAEEQFRRARPDFALVLPWGFLDGFLEREADYLRGGGEFIVPLPVLRTVGGAALANVHAPNAPSEARDGVPAGHAR